MAKKVGITGGIGSGKSTVSKLFEFLGIPVYYADDEAKKLMVEDQDLIQELKATFGQETYKDGMLNRAFLANLVFKNEKLLQKLNSIVHPALGKHYEKWHAQQKNTPYTIKEAAILFEMGAADHMDKVITVFAPVEMRINRVIKRDKVTKESVLDRIARQMPDDEKVEKADFVIMNDGNQSLIAQIIEIHKELTT
ncbi:MAG: dephospho-CoA kinase [Bacteroidetes bacterium]|nr:MAG: dephospho-CoA kinase [Bacteroidota bacterium]